MTRRFYAKDQRRSEVFTRKTFDNNEVRDPVMVCAIQIAGLIKDEVRAWNIAWHFTVVSDTFIKATVPRGATSGYVTVTTPSAVLRSNVPFRVIP
jgi:hypothetical protein